MDGGIGINRNYIGCDAQRMRGVLNLTYPIVDGQIKNWDQMCEVWDYCFHALDINPKEHRFLITEPPMTAHANREKLVSTFMDKYKARGVYIATSGTLALYSAGKTTGVVVDSGDCVTHTVPVFEGFSIPHAVKKNLIGGRAITNHIIELLNYDGIK
jgi:actin-related protein